MNNLSIKIKQIDPLELKNFEIQDVSKKDSSGRRFILKSTKSSTKELKLKSIYKKLEKLSKLKNQNPEEKLAKLNALKDFIKVIRDADESAEAALNERHTYYKIVTWFLRIFSFGSHTKNLDHFDKIIQKKINKTNAEILEIQALTQAVKDGNVDYIKHLISKGMNFDVQDKDGETPLHLAAARPDSEILNLIISSGSNINMTNSKGEIALFSSTKENLKILLESNIQAGLPSKKCTFFRHALFHNKWEIVDLFIEIKGINYQDENQNTPLIHAIMLGKEDFAQKLIANGADVNLWNRKGLTPLIYTIEKNKIDIAEKLIEKGANVNYQNSEGRSALMKGAIDNRIEMVKMLINHGADLNLSDNKGNNAILWSLCFDKVEITKILIDNGADLINEMGNTALLIALKSNHIDIAKLIINKGVNLNYQANGISALMMATGKNQIEIVNLLIDKGADLDLIDTNGCTALLAALAKNNIDIAKLIINKGVNFNHQSSDGMSFLMMATAKNQIEIVDLLISKGADLNLTNNDGNNALLIALNSNYIDIAKLIINKGINFNHQNIKGTTALVTAAINNQIEIVDLLISKGADLDLITKMDHTVLTAAIACSSSIDILKNLVSHGANLNLQIGLGTALVIAKLMERKDIADILKASLQDQELIAQKEMLNSKVLGHTINGKGAITIKTKDSTQIYNTFLEGSIGSYFWKNITKVNQAFSKKYPKLMSDQEALRFKNLIKKNSLEEINNGILLDTGFNDHAVKILIVGSFLFLINRGGASRKPVEVFQYNPKNLNQEILDKIKNHKANDEDFYKQLVFTELPQKLGFQPKGNFELAVENFCSKYLPMQTVGNCAWASSEGGMFVFFLMNQLQSFPSQIDPSQEKEILNKFHSWLSFSQTYNLERYLGTDVLRANPNKADRRKEARKAIDINYPLLISSIQTIKANALKTNDPNKALDILKDVLAEALVTINGDPQSAVTANEIVNNIKKITVSKLQGKFTLGSG